MKTLFLINVLTSRFVCFLHSFGPVFLNHHFSLFFLARFYLSMSDHNPRLNLWAKSLFLRFYPNNKYENLCNVKDRLKPTVRVFNYFWNISNFQLISNDFFLAARLYKCYVLRLSSFIGQEYGFHVENYGPKKMKCGLHFLDFDQLKKLSRWFHVSYLDLSFKLIGSDKEAQKHQSDKLTIGYRRVWTEIYPG